jgi:RNA polymerase sigma-70 factor, ECF subfamily
MTDEQESRVLRLLREARGGDDAARDELFSQCRNYVNLVARSQVETWMRTKVDASDLVQQTLLEAHRGFEAFRGETEAEWLAWLRRILTHNTHDFIRQYRQTDKRRIQKEVAIRHVGADGDSFSFEPAGDDPTPSEILSGKEREIELANALAELSEDHQEVIRLRNLQRLAFEEIAIRMNRSRPAVQMLWTRALQSLQKELQRRHAEQGGQSQSE